MAIAPCKKETRSNSKLFRDQKVPRRPTSQRPVAEARALIWPAESALCRPFLYLGTEAESENSPTQHCAYSDLSPFYIHQSGIVLTNWACRANRSSGLVFMGFGFVA